MKYYFWGFLLVFLDFDIALPYGGVLNLLPGFLGYALLILATRPLAHENDHFRRLKRITSVAFAVGIAEFILDMIALPLPTAAQLVIRVVITVVALYVAYEFTEGAKALERSRYKKLDADKVSTAWLILCMSSLLMFLTFYFSDVFLPCLIVKLLSVVWFQSATLQFERKLCDKK